MRNLLRYLILLFYSVFQLQSWKFWEVTEQPKGEVRVKKNRE